MEKGKTYDVRLIERRKSWGFWSINGYEISFKSFVKSEMDVKELLDSIELMLKKSSSLNKVVEKYSFTSVNKLLISLFRDEFYNYLYKICSGKDVVVITDKKIFNEVFNRKIDESAYSIELIDILNQVVNDVNANSRLNRLVKTKNLMLNEKYEIKNIKSDKNNCNHTWEINGKTIGFTGKEFLTAKNVKAIMMEIENCLLNFSRFDELMNEISPVTIMRVSSILFPEQLEKYMTKFAKEFTENLIVITKKGLSEYIFSKDSGYVHLNDEYYVIIGKVVSNEYDNQCEILPQKSRNINFQQDIWVLYSLERKKSIITHSFNFTDIKGVNIKKEIKRYIFHLLIHTKNSMELVRRYLSNIKRILEYIQGTRTIIYFADIQNVDIINFYEYLSQDEKMSLSTMSHLNSSIKKYCNWIMENSDEIRTKRPIKNYFEDIAWKEINAMSKNTEYIPEEIVEKMLENIDSLNQEYQSMLLIMLNTGLHFKDVILLTEDSLSYDEENHLNILNHIQWKSLNSRRKSGKSDFIDLPINKVATQELLKQKEKSKELRTESGLKEIFIHLVGKSNVRIFESKGFNNAVNTMIKKNNIVDNEGSLWHFTSRQCRKTLAVDMIMSGASLLEVANYLNDVEETANKYYAEVRKVKLAQMNSEFWAEQFKLLIPEKHLKNFSEEELKRIFVDFKMQIREVELGYCLKQVWEGGCNKRNGKVSCVNCNKLCTGLKNLPKWIKLRDSQKNIIANLVKMYERLGDSNYKDYREYQREQHILDCYEDVIKRITDRFGGSCSDNKEG